MTKSRFTSVAIAIYAVVALIALLVAPWWSLAVVSLVFGLAWRTTSPGFAFWVGLLVGGVVYFVGCLWHAGTTSGLPDMLAALFGVGGRWGLYFLSALTGGLLAGLSAMTGAYAGAVVRPTRAEVIGEVV